MAALLAGCGGDDGGSAAATSAAPTSAAPTSAPAGGPATSAPTTTGASNATTTTTTNAATSTSTSPTSAPGAQRVEVTYANGAVTGGVKRAKLTAGKPVSLAITSDVADEVHVHGYDIERALAAGQTTIIDFNADIPGVFEVELHHAGHKLAELEVR